MAKPKIIVRPKRIVTRKQRKAIVDTTYLLDENKKIHKTTDSQLVIASIVLPTTSKQKNKKEYVGRKKDRKKTREKKKAKRIQEQQDYPRKSKKKKRKSKPTPQQIEAKPAPQQIEAKSSPIGIESKSVEDDYIPTVDIFEIIEDYIMAIPAYIETWRKGSKGYTAHDMQPNTPALAVNTLEDTLWFAILECRKIKRWKNILRIMSTR